MGPRGTSWTRRGIGWPGPWRSDCCCPTRCGSARRPNGRRLGGLCGDSSGARRAAPQSDTGPASFALVVEEDHARVLEDLADAQRIRADRLAPLLLEEADRGFSNLCGLG